MIEILFGALFLSFISWSNAQADQRALADRLSSVRERVVTLEQSLIDGEHSRQNVQSQIKKIKKLLALQKEEQALGQKRLSELENTVQELEKRKQNLAQQILQQQLKIRSALVAIEASDRNHHSAFNEKVEAPRRKALANLSAKGLKEIEILHNELKDAGQLEVKIQEEKQQLTYLVHDLKEQEGILELNHQLQLDFLKKKRHEHLSQLENYQKLKKAEAQIEGMIDHFNVRKELSQVINQGEFIKLKGKLPFPVADGKIISNFGRSFDPRSGLYVFKKGLEIVSRKSQPVRAISAGKIAYAGEMLHYGQVVIIDHGEHFYTLCAHLGGISKKASERVAAGDLIGLTGDSDTPLYFEIRARNVAVNPLQWIIN